MGIKVSLPISLSCLVQYNNFCIVLVPAEFEFKNEILLLPRNSAPQEINRCHSNSFLDMQF